jgi:hypothetical protein
MNGKHLKPVAKYDELKYSVPTAKWMKWKLSELPDTNKADPVADVRTLLSLADREGLGRLQAALAEGRAVRGLFEAEQQGCLVYFALDGISDFDELSDYDFPSEAAEMAVYRAIDAWDDEELSEASVMQAIYDVVEERRQANELEDEAVLRCQLRSMG